MTFSFSNLSDALRHGAAISAEDVLAARRWAWADGAISEAEAETIFQLNTLAQDPSDGWIDFFVEAISEYVVNQQDPRGYVDDAGASWLMRHIDADGRVGTAGELELLVKVMETAVTVPASLKSYALRQIEAVVVTGEGPTRRGGDLRPGSIDEAEVALLRRLLFAGAGEGALTVSRDEAELLWRLKDACANGDNGPGWETLFVQAVGNHLMVHNLYRPLARDEAVRLEAFASDHDTHIGRFLGRMFGSLGEADLGDAVNAVGPEDHDIAVVAPDGITSAEEAWLQDHVRGDAHVDPLEQALLSFIAEERAR